VKRSVKATAKRTLRRAVTWKPKQEGTESLDIAALISPLRYDVLVRAQFFGFLAGRPAGESDDDLVAAAWGEPYAVWFREVAMRRFRPWVLEDQRQLQANFRERVLASAALRRSFLERGFDSRAQVTLRVSKGEQRSESGARVVRTLHVGDGGHRLAMLLQSGSELLPGMYRLDPRPIPLIDNTAVLLPSLQISEDDYLKFIAPGYTTRPCRDLAELREAVKEQGEPARLTELDSIIEAHARAGTKVD
jgi:hypothetical protein